MWPAVLDWALPFRQVWADSGLCSRSVTNSSHSAWRASSVSLLSAVFRYRPPEVVSSLNNGVELWHRQGLGVPADERVHNICKTLRLLCCFERVDGYMDIVMGRFSHIRSSPTFYLALVAQVLRTIELSGVLSPSVTPLTFVGSPFLWILFFLEKHYSTVSSR